MTILFNFDFYDSITNKKEKIMQTGASVSVTITKMIETLPESMQELALEHMQQYIEDIRDELKWKDSIGKSQGKLIAAARQARKDIMQGKATPLDSENL